MVNMIPTRIQIQDKIYEIEEDTHNGLESWLTAMGCPFEDMQMILADLDTYERT